MQTTHKELGAVELLLLAGLVALEAAATLLIALLALVLTIAGWSPASAAPQRPTAQVSAAPTPEPIQPAATPQPHPISELASQAAAALQPLTVAQLRRLARSAGLPRAISRNGRRSALLDELVALQVAVA